MRTKFGSIIGTLCTLVVLGGAPAFATPVSIGFEGTHSLTSFPPITEDGFVYSIFSGGLFSGVSGPDRNMQGEARAGGGVLRIVSSTSGEQFNFLQLALREFDRTGALGINTITVDGYLMGGLQKSETYTPAQAITGFSAYETQLATAGNLLGTTIDELRITLPGFLDPTTFLNSQAVIDDVQLDKMIQQPIPEPSTLLLFNSGLVAGLIAWRFRNRKAP